MGEKRCKMGNYDLITFLSVCSAAHTPVLRSRWGMSQAEHIFHHVTYAFDAGNRKKLGCSGGFGRWIGKFVTKFTKRLEICEKSRKFNFLNPKTHLNPHKPHFSLNLLTKLQEHQRWNDLNWNEEFLWQVPIYKCKLCLKMCFYVCQIGWRREFSRLVCEGLQMIPSVCTGKIDENFYSGKGNS